MNQKLALPGLNMGACPAVGAPSEGLSDILKTPALHALLDSFREAIILCDGNSRIQFINVAAEHTNKISKKVAVGLSNIEFFQRSALGFDDFQSAVGRGRSSALTQCHKGKNFVTSLHVIPAGSDEKPYSLLVQRELDAEGRLQRSSQPATSQGAPGGRGDPESGALHLSPRLSGIADTGVRAFRRRARLLLLGESGVGKTAIAQYIHRAAGWGGRPFVHVNCGSIPDSLFESEMFGYEQGAFTGALRSGKRGYIESAAGGTLFLDEIGEIPLHVQAKLLKFLEDGSIQSVGSALSKAVQVQVIAATNKDLRSLVEAGTFRADLYYRLAVLTVDIPPLRQHLEDLPSLMDVLLQRINRDRHPSLRLSEGCRQRLLQHDYPGNIRELVNIFERLSVLADDEAQEHHLPLDLCGVREPMTKLPPVMAAAPAAPLLGESCGNLKSQVVRYEREVILRAVATYGSKRKAAQHLGIDVGTLIRKLQRD